ncbi:MAG: hypothetical protein ACRCYV_07250 [Aeromonas sp.]
MIEIPALRTKRLTVRLRELTIRDAMALAVIPPELQHEAASRFLLAAVEQVEGVADPADWTVQERTLAICHYMAHTLDDGPDFALAGGDCHYSDYLLGEVDYPADRVALGTLSGDCWHMRQLTGRLAQAIERLEGEVGAISPFTHWQVGLMAAQLVPNDDDGIGQSDGDLDAVLLARMQVLLNYPEGDFAQLAALFYQGEQQLAHLLRISHGDDGVIVMPARSNDEEVSALPPARFCASACITPLARRMAGKPRAAGA